MQTVHVIDYGVGNIFNVVRALKHLNFQVKIYQQGEEFDSPQCVVLPGVGAFGDCMQSLYLRDFIAPIKNYVKNGGFLLGICVGMHVLAEVGEEFGFHQGLGLISGRVKPITVGVSNSKQIKIPHVAWSTLYANKNNEHYKFILNKEYYFVHSFKFCCDNPSHEIAYTRYSNISIAAMVRNKNVLGLQFHPEKSGRAGLELLQKLINLAFVIPNVDEK